jgi:hypothetical protein
VGHPLLTGARRRKHAHPRGGAGCFCSELTAIGNSSSGEILGRLWFGDLKNSEMTFGYAAVLHCFVLNCNYRKASLPRAHLPNLEEYGPELYHISNISSI